LSHNLKRLPARFYRSNSGREPVREWLKKLDHEDRRIIGEDIKDVEYSWPIGMPLVRSLGDGLWEVRSNLTGGKIARVIFAVEHGSLVLLHGFVKKTQRLPKQDLDLALRRRRGGDV
jgi:phage-related protein